ncbi:MAG: hypothetical protein C4521_00960 [Actinobacteria bacterium]|nr:MAG: hypothetical protein C4521_00960 [Actinomycetota bacterium]
MATPSTISIPATLRNPHPAIAALRDNKRHFDLTPSVRNRALRVLQALIKAAEQKGYQVKSVEKCREGYRYGSYESKDHLVIDTGETREGVRIFQQRDRARHTPTREELAEQERWGRRPPVYDYAPNKFLRLELNRHWDGHRHSWSEGPRGPIDKKLPGVLDEISRRHEQAMQRRLSAEEERAEREREWYAVHERAEVLLQEANRAEVLMAQADRWRRACEIRGYVAAMTSVAEGLDDPAMREKAKRWIRWATDYCESLDPFNQPIEMPEEIEITAESLRPFMQGWDPWGPPR